MSPPHLSPLRLRSGSASGGYSSGLEAAYHNYGMDMESWRSDKYSNGRYKVRPDSSSCMLALFSSLSLQRGSSSSSGGGTQNGYASNYRGQGGAEHRDKERGHQGEASPYQSGLYDSWKTEWNPTYRDYQTTHYPYPTSSYMTKGGRRWVVDNMNCSFKDIIENMSL